MVESRKRPVMTTTMEFESHKRAMTDRASGAKFRHDSHIPSQSYTRSGFSTPMPKIGISSRSLHKTQNEMEDFTQEAGEDPSDTYFDDFRPENNLAGKLANYVRPKQLKQPVQGSTALMWQHIMSLPQIEAKIPQQLPKVPGEFYTHLMLPRVRNIELNPRFSGKSFNVKWGSNSVALAVYLTGEEAERPCKKCAGRSGPFVGCVLPAKSVLQRISIVSCANCRYNWQGKHCKWYVNNKETRNSIAPPPLHTNARDEGDGRPVMRHHLDPSVSKPQGCATENGVMIVHYNQTQGLWSDHATGGQGTGQSSSSITPEPKNRNSEQIVEHHVVDHHLEDVIDRFFQSLPKLKDSVKRIDRLASVQRKKYLIPIKQEYETESEASPDSSQIEFGSVIEPRIAPGDVPRDSDWEAAPGIYRGQHDNQRIAYSAAYLESTSSPIPVHDGVGARLENVVPGGIGHVLPSEQCIQICFVYGGTVEVTIGVDQVIVSTGGMFKVLESHGAMIRNLGQVDITVCVVALDA